MRQLLEDISKQINEGKIDLKPKGTKKSLTAKPMPNDPADPTVLVRGFGRMKKSQAEKLKMTYEEYESLEEIAKWRKPEMKGKTWESDPFEDREDEYESKFSTDKNNDKIDKLAAAQEVRKSVSVKDPQSLAAKWGPKYAKKYGMDTKQHIKNFREEIELTELMTAVKPEQMNIQRGPTQVEMEKATAHVAKNHDKGHKIVGVTVGLDGKTQVKSSVTQTSIVGEPVKPPFKKSVTEGVESDLPVISHKSPYEGAEAGEYTRLFHASPLSSQKFAKKVIAAGGKARIGRRGNDYYVYHNKLIESAVKEESKWSTPPSEPATNLKRGDIVAVQHPTIKHKMIFGTYLQTSNHKQHSKNGQHLIKYNNKQTDDHTGLHWHKPEHVFHDVGDNWKQPIKVNEAVETKVQLTMPLFIRILEWAKEEAKDDVALHQLAEKLAAIADVADMDDYKQLIG